MLLGAGYTQDEIDEHVLEVEVIKKLRADTAKEIKAIKKVRKADSAAKKTKNSIINRKLQVQGGVKVVKGFRKFLSKNIIAKLVIGGGGRRGSFGSNKTQPLSRTTDTDESSDDTETSDELLEHIIIPITSRSA